MCDGLGLSILLFVSGATKVDSKHLLYSTKLLDAAEATRFRANAF